MTEAKFRYGTPSAFRQALKDLCGQIAREDQRYSLDELQRQFAYDRALARLFSSDDADRWVLKGAGALLARLAVAGTARMSMSSSVTILTSTSHGVAPLQEEAKGARLHLNARLGPTLFATFHIDVVVGTAMTGIPDAVAPLTPLEIEGLVRRNIGSSRLPTILPTSCAR